MLSCADREIIIGNRISGPNGGRIRQCAAKSAMGTEVRCFKPEATKEDLSKCTKRRQEAKNPVGHLFIGEEIPLTEPHHDGSQSPPPHHFLLGVRPRFGLGKYHGIRGYG